MKGIGHFAVGVAAASCFPAAVQAAIGGNPLYFILGGVFGLLPDTLDFKFYRFFYTCDVEVIPDPLAPDPELIADALRQAVSRVLTHGVPVRIKLHTIRESSDRWRRYTIAFDVAQRRIVVTVGPPVDTGGNVIMAGDTWNGRTATVPLPGLLHLDYLATTVVDVFDGPVYRFAPTGKGVVRAEFIPWHRQWSHSVACALACSLAGWWVWGGLAAAVIACAVLTHIGVDQLGFMGCNTFFLFRPERRRGMQLMQSSDILPNLIAVWMACILTFWNLYSAGHYPGLFINPVRLLVFGFALPLSAGLGLRRWIRREGRWRAPPVNGRISSCQIDHIAGSAAPGGQHRRAASSRCGWPEGR